MFINSFRKSASLTKYKICESEEDNTWTLSSIRIDKKFRTEHTKKQLEEANFGWVFNCPGIDVEEVEE